MLQQDAIEAYALRPEQLQQWAKDGRLPVKIRSGRINKSFHYLDLNKLKPLMLEFHGGYDGLQKRLAERELRRQARDAKCRKLAKRKGNTTKQREKREEKLLHELQPRGLTMRTDSAFCEDYILNCKGALSLYQTVLKMEEEHILMEHTMYFLHRRPEERNEYINIFMNAAANFSPFADIKASDCKCGRTVKLMDLLPEHCHPK